MAVPSGAPLNFAITVDETALNCSWEPPSEGLRNGNITSYTIMCLVGDDTAVNVTLSNIQQTTLNLYAPSTTYNCTIYASTSVGDGPVSEYVNATTEGDTVVKSTLHVLNSTHLH